MVRNAPSAAPEVQKFTEAKEVHDDKKLSADVEKFQKLIATGDSAELKKQFQNYRVEGIGNFEGALLKIDLMNRAKDGRVISIQKDGFLIPSPVEPTTDHALVKNGSNLAKLIQIYTIAYDASVQKKDFAKSLQGVDGNLERFTMQGLTQVIAGIKNRSALNSLSNDLDSQSRSRPIKAMGVDVETSIQRTGEKNESLRKERNMSVDLIGNNLTVGSYKNVSTLDLKTGKMAFGGEFFGGKEYPITVHLVRDRDNKENPLMIESEVDRENIKNAMKLMNLVHYVVSEFMNDARKATIRDVEKPFIIAGGVLKIDDSIWNKTDIVTQSKLQSLLTDARSGISEDPQLMASFLNEIFRSQNPIQTVNRGSTYVGGRKPILSNP